MTENSLIYDDQHIPKSRGKIFITPLGIVDQVAVRVVAANLQTFFDLRVDVEAPMPCPDHALMPGRSQYHAAKIMSVLEKKELKESEKRIGVISEDIALPFLTHVFGEAQVNGRAAVISTSRLKGEKTTSKPSKSLVYERLAKIAIHETGHLLGLLHCREKNCLMGFSASLDQLDALPPSFCQSCTRYLTEVFADTETGINTDPNADITRIDIIPIFYNRLI